MQSKIKFLQIEIYVGISKYLNIKLFDIGNLGLD